MLALDVNSSAAELQQVRKELSLVNSQHLTIGGAARNRREQTIDVRMESATNACAADSTTKLD